MPKTNYCKPHSPLPAIKHWMARNEIRTEKEVYEGIGMNHVTWTRRKKEPWKFTLEEIMAMNDIAKFSEEELRGVVE